MFDPWVGKIPWRRKWQHIPVFLPEKSHGWKNLPGYSPWGHKEMDGQSNFTFFGWLEIFNVGIFKVRNSRKLLPWANMMNLGQKNTGSVGTHFLNFLHSILSTDYSSLEHKNFIPFAFENQSRGKRMQSIVLYMNLTHC